MSRFEIDRQLVLPQRLAGSGSDGAHDGPRHAGSQLARQAKPRRDGQQVDHLLARREQRHVNFARRDCPDVRF